MTTATSSTPKTFVPAPGLVVKNTSTNGGPSLFCLFTKDWLTLQTYIVQTLQLPINKGDFKEKYGTFVDEDQIEGCLSAMQKVNALSKDFGNPTELLKELGSNPGLLNTDTAPEQLYLHIVWFAKKLFQTARTFDQTFGQFMELLNATPKDQRQAVITDILTGEGGLQSEAVAMEKLANDLISALSKFNTKLSGSTDVMKEYTSNSSTFYNDAVAAITTDISDIETYKKAADDAFKLWRDLTISAVTVSIGIMIFTAGLGWPLAATAAGVLGHEAKVARDAYDKAMRQENGAEADEKKKILLKGDLDALNKQMVPVNKAAQGFINTLQNVAGVWTSISGDLDYISKNFTPDQFENLPVFKDAMKLDDATQDWKEIATKAEQYTEHSLVSYTVVKFGTPLPNVSAN